MNVEPDRLQALPGAVYVGQVESLYTDRKSVVMGLVNTGLCGCLTIYLTASLFVAAPVLCFLAIGLVRLHYFDGFRRLGAKLGASVGTQLAISWERGYTIGASFYLFGLGLWTCAAFAVTADPFPGFVALCATVISAFGIPFRNFAFARGVQIQLVSVAVPLSAACLYLGGRYYLFALLVLVPTFLFIKTSAVRLRGLLLNELIYRHRSERTAARLGMTINSMPLGVCLLAPDRSILLANATFTALVGAAGPDALVGRRIAAVLRLLHRRNVVDAAGYRRLTAWVAASVKEERQCLAGLDVIDGRCFDVSLDSGQGENAVLVIQDVTAQRTAQRVVDEFAWFDAVTGLPNRRSFERSLADALATGKERQTAILFIDLDNFKQVNDTLGHRRGDTFLTVVGNRLRETAGEGKTVARWGGDEFVVLIGDASATDPSEVASAIVAALSRPCEVEGYEIIAGASIGIALSQDGDSADTLLQHADMALYTAKTDGRNQVRLYRAEMNETAQMRRQLELDVRNAMTAQAFELHYQPIIDLRSGAVVSFEALARWRHPTRGFVPPITFIPIIEDLGLVNEFGAWVLETACRECAGWPDNIRVGVNLSAIQIRSDRGFEAKVLAALGKSGLQTDRLEVEITESTLLEAGEQALATLQRLRSLGVRIALDDFGTGYSSLSYLLSFPLDKVKIDRSFIAALSTKGQATILVDSVASLGAQLGMTVTAEGIETEAQLEFLRALRHVTEGQGYLFSKPLAPADVWPLLEARRDARKVS